MTKPFIKTKGMLILAPLLTVAMLVMPRAVDLLSAQNYYGSGQYSNQLTVNIGDNYFSPSTMNVAAGTTVVWINNGTMAHTVTADNGAFDSGTLNPGQSFSWYFNTAGTFGYHCRFHGAPGSGMFGSVSVTSQTNNQNGSYNGGITNSNSSGMLFNDWVRQNSANTPSSGTYYNNYIQGQQNPTTPPYNNSTSYTYPNTNGSLPPSSYTTSNGYVCVPQQYYHY